ncbi:MAG: CPBP family intramembrane glutamic endopeptidase [Erysipelotrichaceae bacterium]
MSEKTSSILTLKQAKKQFTAYGCTLFAYGLIVYLSQSFIPYMIPFIQQYLAINSEYLTLIIRIVVILLGIIIPFGLFQILTKTSIKDFTQKSNVTLLDLIKYSIVFTSINMLMLFVTSMVTRFFTVDTPSLLPVGVYVGDYNLYNPLFLVLVILILPICEEYVFRGVTLRYLGKFSNHFAIMSISILYALAFGNIIDSIAAGLFSAFLCLVTLRYKNFLVAVFIHIFNNLFLVLLSFALIQHYLVGIGLLFLLYFMAIVVLIKGYDNRILVKKEKNSMMLLKVFFSNFAIILCVILFICTSLIQQFI